VQHYERKIERENGGGGERNRGRERLLGQIFTPYYQKLLDGRGSGSNDKLVE